MNSVKQFTDARRHRGVIWNVQEVLTKFPFGSSADKWNRGAVVSAETWIDAFVYRGFLAHGELFLRALRGRFAIAVRNENMVFLARDWMGEQTMHYVVTLERMIVANTIGELKAGAGVRYSYNNVRAFPHAHYLHLDIDHRSIVEAMRGARVQLYADFMRSIPVVRSPVSGRSLAAICQRMRERLLAATAERAAAHRGKSIVALLSGGLDSFSVALALRVSGVRFESVTLAVRGKRGETETAREFARLLGVRHHVVSVTAREVTAAFNRAVLVGECYHNYNVYCSLCMMLLGARLSAATGARAAFCGEGVNEAVGDYHDWVINRAGGRSPMVVQRVNAERLEKPARRAAYVWGKIPAADFYNKQLGSGLAKHAGARMFKPFQRFELDLEAPYYDYALLRELVSIPGPDLRAVGGKPGLFMQMFVREMKTLGISEALVRDCKKVRFQDASEGGGEGVSALLHAKKCDQQSAIRIFNRHFGANLNAREEARRLNSTA